MHPVVEVVRSGRQVVAVLLREPLVVGRDCEGLIVADSQVSRRHVELRPHDGRVVVIDLGSTNGTFLDGERIIGPTGLGVGGTIVIGTTSLRFVDIAPRASTTGAGRRTTIAPAEADEIDPRRSSIDRVADLVSDDEWHPRPDAGTITILFSDIESSTERVSRIGDAAWFQLLELHNQVVRDELTHAGGREVKSQGDGFMLTFTSVRRALGFAITVQRRLTRATEHDRDGPVRVRMGLHTGEVITDASGDLFGRHVNKAARIANLAAGGQILASGTVREIATGDHEIEFGDGVEVELRGLDGLHAVYEVFWSAC